MRYIEILNETDSKHDESIQHAHAHGCTIKNGMITPKGNSVPSSIDTSQYDIETVFSTNGIPRIRVWSKDGNTFIGDGTIQYIGEDKLTIHAWIKPEYQRKGLATLFIKYIQQVAQEEKRTIEKPGYMSDNATKFWKGRNYFRGSRPRLESINEGRDAPLYHMMDAKKAESVFKNDTMYATTQHKLPSHGYIFGSSFTRFAQRWQKAFGSVWLTLDQTKLSHRHKIIPVDGESVLGYKQGAKIGDYRDRLSEQFAEEFVIGDINNLHNYLTSIMIVHTNDRYLRPEQIEIFEQACKKYSEQWNIPLKHANRLISRD